MKKNLEDRRLAKRNPIVREAPIYTNRNVIAHNVWNTKRLEFELSDSPAEIICFTDAVVTRRMEMDDNEGLLEPKIRGGIYDDANDLIPGFVDHAKRMRGYEPWSKIGAERRGDAERVEADCLYLGTLHGHFGHFLIESLSRAWALSAFHPKILVVFHYANGTPEGLTTDLESIDSPSYVRSFLSLLGITRDRLILANRDLNVKRLFVPSDTLVFDGSAHRSLPFVYDYMASLLPAERSVRRSFYITRTGIAGKSVSAKKKSVVNENEIEDLFRKRGWEIISPETLSIDEQVVLFRDAARIAGTTGSALHMILFCKNPDTEFIAIDWRVAKTQFMLDTVRGLKAWHVLARAQSESEDLPRIDVVRLERTLAMIYPNDEDVRAIADAKAALLRDAEAETTDKIATGEVDAEETIQAERPTHLRRIRNLLKRFGSREQHDL